MGTSSGANRIWMDLVKWFPQLADQLALTRHLEVSTVHNGPNHLNNWTCNSNLFASKTRTANVTELTCLTFTH